MKKVESNKDANSGSPAQPNYSQLYRLYDFILSPEWDALAEETESVGWESKEVTGVETLLRSETTKIERVDHGNVSETLESASLMNTSLLIAE
jgi:hypothetical protein